MTAKIRIPGDAVATSQSEQCLGSLRYRVTPDEKLVLEQEFLVIGYAQVGGSLVPLSEKREWRDVPVVAAPEYWAAKQASGEAVRFEIEPTAGFITILRRKQA